MDILLQGVETHEACQLHGDHGRPACIPLPRPSVTTRKSARLRSPRQISARARFPFPARNFLITKRHPRSYTSGKGWKSRRRLLVPGIEADVDVASSPIPIPKIFRLIPVVQVSPQS